VTTAKEVARTTRNDSLDATTGEADLAVAAVSRP